MTAIGREDAQTVLEGGGVEIRAREIGGDMMLAFIRVPAGWDLAPLLVGLPDDLCQCPHWGYLLSGRLKLATKDGDELFEAGQAFYWSPGTLHRRSKTPSTWSSRRLQGLTSSPLTSRRRWTWPVRRGVSSGGSGAADALFFVPTKR